MDSYSSAQEKLRLTFDVKKALETLNVRKAWLNNRCDYITSELDKIQQDQNKDKNESLNSLKLREILLDINSVLNEFK